MGFWDERRNTSVYMSKTTINISYPRFTNSQCKSENISKCFNKQWFMITFIRIVESLHIILGYSGRRSVYTSRMTSIVDHVRYDYIIALDWPGHLAYLIGRTYHVTDIRRLLLDYHWLLIKSKPLLKDLCRITVSRLLLCVCFDFWCIFRLQMPVNG